MLLAPSALAAGHPRLDGTRLFARSLAPSRRPALRARLSRQRHIPLQAILLSPEKSVSTISSDPSTSSSVDLVQDNLVPSHFSYQGEGQVVEVWGRCLPQLVFVGAAPCACLCWRQTLCVRGELQAVLMHGRSQSGCTVLDLGSRTEPSSTCPLVESRQVTWGDPNDSVQPT